MSQDTINLILEPREVTGKAVKHLRKGGQVPAIIHDHGKPSIAVQGDTVAILKVWRQAGKHHPVEIKTGDKSFTALIKEAEFDPRKHLLTHVVFNAVDKNQQVEAEVPVHAQYAEGNDSTPAERSGLIVLAQLEVVVVKATPSQIPDVLYYDAEKLVEVGDHLSVSDLVIPSDVELVTEANHPLATVFEPSALQAANDTAGGDAEPEDAENVESEEGSAETDDQTGGKDEQRPGGKKEAEDHDQATSPTKE